MNLRTTFAILFAAAATLAQTTGVPGINDYTINSLGSGTTSCTTFCFPNGNLNLNLQVSAPAGAFAIVLFNFCPCTTCSLPGPTNACLPLIPSTACGASTNQSLDMSLTAACGIAFSAVLAPNSAGTPGLSMQLPIPAFTGLPCMNATLSTQAAVIDPCGMGLFGLAGPFVMTQSYTLNF
jgi:hypothetical protein